MTHGATPAHILTTTCSREATDSLLGGLHAQGWRPPAWLGFLVDASRRSLHQAGAHPVALAETTALHLVIASLAGRRNSPWVASSWVLTASHLGLLEERRSLGLPNLLTLARANLPVLAGRVGPWAPILALASDFLDGRLARGTASQTIFGKHADFLADTAFWTWYVMRYEPSGRVQALTFAAWLLPAVGVTAASFASGRMIDVPRFRWLRPCAAAEVLIGARALQRSLSR